MAFGAALAVMAATGQGVAAFATPPPVPGRAAGIAAEQASAASAGLALGIGSGERLVVKDVITDTDGSTHVRYNRTFNGLRVIGGDLVSHRDRAGNVKSVSWNASHDVAVPTTTPKITLASAQTAGARSASSAQASTSP